MYNRYIPQPDGSYRRSAVPDRQPPPKPRPPEPTPVCPCEPPPPAPPPPPPSKNPPCPPPNSGVGGFLRQLLPRDFDTSDLLIVLLLLLMAGDCPEDQNHALLTLALYLFM